MSHLTDFDTLDAQMLAQNGKIIHQIWFGTIPNKRSARKAYEKLQYYRDSWKERNPNWYHIEWSKEMCKELVGKYFSEHAEMFGKYRYEIQRCDTIRYLILYRYGGLYADMDYYCNRPFDEVFEKYTNDIYLVQSPNGTALQDSDHVSNSLMYSRPKHPFWKKLMLEIEINKETPIYYTKHLMVMFTTGPGIVNRVYSKYKYRFKVKSWPYKLFHPYGITSGLRTTNLDPEVFAAHISKGSWSSKDTAFLNTIVRDWPLMLLIILGMLVPIVIQLINRK